MSKTRTLWAKNYRIYALVTLCRTLILIHSFFIFPSYFFFIMGWGSEVGYFQL